MRYIAVFLLILITVPLSALPAVRFKIENTQNTVPGFNYSFVIRAININSNTDRTWNGTAVLSSTSQDTIFNENPADILSGTNIDNLTYKETGPVNSFIITASDPSGRIQQTSVTLQNRYPDQENGFNFLILNEIMYDLNSDANYDWIEFYNPLTTPLIFNGLKLYSNPNSSDAKYNCELTPFIPPGLTTVPAHGYLLFTVSPYHFLLEYPELYYAIRDKTPPYTNILLVSPADLFDGISGNSSLNPIVLKSNNASTNYFSLSLYSGDWGGKNGYSLERINVFSRSSDPDNWVSSLFPGGTPGLPNGQIIQNIDAPPAEGRIELSSSSWKSTDPQIGIRIRTEAALLDAQICVLRSDGYTVRVLEESLNLPAHSDKTLLYDCTDADGNTLTSGLYVLLFTGLSPSGKVSYGRTLIIRSTE